MRRRGPQTAATSKLICLICSRRRQKRRREQGTCLAVIIDEIQYFNKKELGALIMSMHRMQQRQLPLVLLGAGLPILPGLAGESQIVC